MYYKTKWFEGCLMFKGTPKGKYKPCSPQQIINYYKAELNSYKAELQELEPNNDEIEVNDDEICMLGKVYKRQDIEIITKAALNLGMTIRQNQLNGSDTRSGNEILAIALNTNSLLTLDMTKIRKI